MLPPNRRLFGSGIAMGAVLLAAIATDMAFGWFAGSFRLVAHLFYEKSALAQVREPSQIVLARIHLWIWVGLAALGLMLAPLFSRKLRRLWCVLWIGYGVRAVLWVAAGNLPLVPGDSCHYVEVATSVYRGEGPVKHYVESFFVDYTRHGFRERGAVLDDWATPLWAYVLAGVYQLIGVVPGESLEATFAVAKATSFVISVFSILILYAWCRRSFSPEIGMWAAGLMAILPVHALYAAFELRESLVVFVSLLTVWGVTELMRAQGNSAWGWAAFSGIGSGLAILARTTSFVLVLVCGVFLLCTVARKRLRLVVVWFLCGVAVIGPWAWLTWQVYGEPFFTYTKYYAFNFSWAVHHFDKGNTRADQFFRVENIGSIARVKLKSLLTIVVYSTMMLSVPVVLGYWFALRQSVIGARGRHPEDEGRNISLSTYFSSMLLVAFALATLIQVSDVTQVQQLGRYYLPVYVIMLPVACAGLVSWTRAMLGVGGRWVVAVVVAASLWSSPGWAHDASWLTSTFQLRWPALQETGAWIRTHPDEVPRNARILTWFPWELRVTSDRSTVLFPRALEGGAYELKRVEETIRRYGVTHVLWGSFETSFEGDPELLGQYLGGLRESLGLVDSRLVYTTTGLPHPLRLYRLRESAR